jgi:hypothetical protein
MFLLFLNQSIVLILYYYSRLQHPNVLLMMGACTTPGKMAIITEIMPKVKKK